MPDTPKPTPPKPSAPSKGEAKQSYSNKPFVRPEHLTVRPFKDALADLQRQMSKENHPSNAKRRR